MSKLHEIASWVYKYDRSSKVWRALHIGTGTEVNQYHLNELRFLMGHINDKVTWDQSVILRVPPLTDEAWAKFIVGDKS